MCGITGFLDARGTLSDDERRRRVAAMAAALRHRGPDEAGVWTEEGAPVALAHRRLSIIDLTPTGRQPMVSSDDRYVIVYNGEA